MTEKDSRIPKDRCGFVLQFDNITVTVRDETPSSGNSQHKYKSDICCWRTVWKEGRCIWHADVEDKPLKELVAARTNTPERLDGTILRDVQLDDVISFAECGLSKATFDNVELENADFTNANLYSTEFLNVNFRGAKFSDANLHSVRCRKSYFMKAEFPNANLRSAKFSGPMNLQETIFSGANLSFAEFTGTNLAKADFSNANLAAGDFSDTSIWKAKFSDAILRESKFSNANLRQSEFPSANLKGAEFPHADMGRARFPNADLAEAEFSNADLWWAEFPAANLDRADFSKADLERSTFSRACLKEATFVGANLRKAFFSRTGGWNADFTEANIMDASFDGAVLYRANFQNSNAQDANFTNSQNDQARPVNLEDAVFEGTDLRGADFSHARLFQAVFTNARINIRTQFDTISIYEHYPNMKGWFRHQNSPQEAAVWVYRRLESLYEENAMSNVARQFYLNKQEARRKHHAQRISECRQMGEYQKMKYHSSHYSVLTLMHRLTNHGESLWRIITRSAGIILLSSLLYPLLGGFASSQTGEIYQFSFTAWREIDTFGGAMNVTRNGILTLLQSLYFSVITFSTIGYGDLYPISAGSKALVGMESLIGAVMVALFIFVLSRRVTR